MKVVCAETVLLGQEAFSSLGETRVLPDRSISREDLLDADALIVRSKTTVNANLLEGTSVQFVATATAGTDHLDISWLDEHDIAWASSPGCNANSVSEYLVAALLTLAVRHDFSLTEKTIGIIGCGEVGGRVARKCRSLGMRVLCNDPPRAAAGEEGFLPLDQVLAASDFVSLHVPLHRQGPWPTHRLADYRFFEQLKPGAIFINAARGGVCDYDALLDVQNAGVISRIVLDVWDPEPAIRTDLIQIADIATPHIAGHSLEGKLNGTLACFRECRHFFERPENWDPSPHLPPPSTPFLEYLMEGERDEVVLHKLVAKVYDIQADDRILRKGLPLEEISRALFFDQLRANYPIRREFSNTRIHLKNASDHLRWKLEGLGFLLD